MSGINGILRFDGATVSARDLERQTTQLTHLGPDRIRTWRQGSIGLGHLMMATTRENAFDDQPLSDGDLCLVADVRLDNREEIAARLAIDPDALQTMSDSALVMASYKTWGADCVDHLIGDFAFAVWDGLQRTLTLARDHMGQRHVFYHKGAGFFAFATEIKGLWALPETPRTLKDDAIARWLLFQPRSNPNSTDYDGVFAVPGGTVLTVSNEGAVNQRRYWRPRADPSHEGRDEAYYVEAYRRVLGEAVACRLRRAPRPVGLFMGGGFDSGAICALAGPALAGQNRKLIAVSSVMPEDYRGTIHHARPWVEMYRRHMPHLDVRYVTRESLDIFTDMEAGFLATDARHSPNRYVTDALIKEIAAAGARVYMDGHGGDYTLNPRVPEALARLVYTGDIRRFVHEFGALRRHLGQTVWQTVVRDVVMQLLPDRWKSRRKRRRKGLAPQGPTMPISLKWMQTNSLAERVTPSRPLGQSLRGKMEQMLSKVQDMTDSGGSISAAAHGLEFTQPYHDKRVVELALAIPENLYFKNGRSRHLARTALKDLYPPAFLDRRPGNDDIGPDFLMMAKRTEPRVLAEIDRMERAGHLSKYFDFPRMRRMLTRRSVDQHASGNEFDTRQAQLAFLCARYIEWFRQTND